MLTSLQVRNFAIVDEVDVEFAPGMTVLTGETGAGKSILVDAMGLVLGERGGTGLVRQGAKRAEFSAQFDLAELPDAAAWLEAQMLDLDGECLLRRVIGADGRSRAFINGNNVPLQSLKSLGELLLDIHGQHFHQSLVRPNVQCSLLDFYAGLTDAALETRDAWQSWRTDAERLAQLETAAADRDARLELLRFQIGEIDALALGTDEYDALMTERQKLQNRGRLAEGSVQALQALADSDHGNAQSLVAEARRSVDSLLAHDDSLQAITEALNEADIQIADAIDGLRRYADTLDMDPARQQFVEDRLDAVSTIARKHRIEPEELALHAKRLTGELSELENIEQSNARLQNAVDEALEKYTRLAGKLSADRRRAAKQFSAAVTAAMADLGMPGGRFAASVDDRDDTTPSRNGMDRITFLISANPGQTPMPISKIASGGELSRMSLAVQVIASGGSLIPTMVFDEVDSGVGGGVAEMVGLRLRDLGETRQVFCVTHLPQVASLADHHFRIAKMTDGNSTRITINDLNDDERTEEIARMLGGVKITDRTRDHASEMLAAGRRDCVENRSA